LKRISIVLVEDHRLFREALCTLIERAKRFEVVAQAADGHEALALARELTPQIVVMDIMMPTLNGFEATIRLRALPVPPQVVILSQYDAPEYVVQAMQSGARGYLLKDSSSDELLAALDAVVGGGHYYSMRLPVDEIEDRLAGEKNQRSELGRLTVREREVLQLVAEGNTNRKIAYMLGISIKTVEKHRFSLMEKLGRRDIASLVRFAVANRVIAPDTAEVENTDNGEGNTP
jgi:DNA-binding NarL/FixJ family response regulator